MTEQNYYIIFETEGKVMTEEIKNELNLLKRTTALTKKGIDFAVIKGRIIFQS